MLSHSAHRRLALAPLALACLLLPAAATAQSALRRQQVRADDGHPLVLWAKRPAARPRGAILLLHGRTWSARPNFDLRVPGQHLSLMDALVARGYAVYALDQRGYGASARDSTGWLTPERAALDAANVLDQIARTERDALRGGRPALLGYSRGAMTAMLAAQRQPAVTSALILYGFPGVPPANATWPPEASEPPRRRTTPSAAGEDFISPEHTLAGTKEAYASTAIVTDSIRTDWRQEKQLAALDPALLRTPTLLLDGERDPYANAGNHATFFPRIGTADRWWVVLPGVDHVAHLEAQRAFVNAVVGFLERERK